MGVETRYSVERCLRSLSFAFVSPAVVVCGGELLSDDCWSGFSSARAAV